MTFKKTKPKAPKSMIKSEQAINTDAQYTQWTRVAPIALAYFFVSSLYFFVTNFLIYLIPVAVVQRDKLFSNLAIVLPLVLALLAFFTALSVIRFWFYHFRLDKTRVEIKQGVFKKSHLDLPFEKIQNVKIEQPFYYRIHKYAMVELETAGSAGSEARIVAMKLAEAQLFKAEVMAYQNETTSDEQATPDASSVHASNEILLNERSIPDLIIHGITNNRVWIFLGAAAPFYDTVVENFSNVLSFIGFDIQQYLNYESLSLAMFLLHVLSIVMVIMLVLVFFSVIASVFVFYKFRLSRLNDKYIRRSGLLNKQEVSMKKSRIQHAVQQQDWLDIIINRANLKLAQNSAGLPNGNQASLNSPNKLIVPSIYRRQSDEIVQDVFGYEKINHAAFLPVSRRLMIRYLLFPILPVLSITLVAILSNEPTLGMWVGFSILSLVLILLGVLRWYRWGYVIDDDFIIIRKGLFGKNIYIFNRQKTQQVKLLQTIFMHKHKKASLKFVLASSAHIIPYIDEQLALALMDNTLLTIEKDKPAWM